MGIRFYCPNGHKLNVKEFQAGQKGICPTCGAKTQIPLESTRPSSREEKMQSQGGAAGTAADASEATAVLPSSPAVAPAPADVSPPTPAAAVAQGSASTTFAPTPEPSAVASAGRVADPLAEAGNVVWYVRPPSGGQFGPVAAEVMRGWFAEGRVATDALVWREGWRDWQQAGSVFPQLSPSSPRLSIPGLEDIYAEPIVNPARKSRPGKHPPPARRKPAIVIGALVLTLIVLLTIVLWVLLQ